MCLLPVAAPAQDDPEYSGPRFDFVPGPQWQEQAVTLPPAPDDRFLMPVELNMAGFPYQVFLDRRALSIGEDGVIRYTVVLQGDGARNVLYEGIRCNTHEYRLYAYGDSDGSFRPASEGWRPLGHLGPDRYRNYFYTDLLCDAPIGPRPLKTIIRNLKYSWGPDVEG